MSVPDAQWSRLGDAIVVREADGTFITFLDASKGGAAGGAPPDCERWEMTTRQHAETNVTEVAGARLEELLAVIGDEPDKVVLLVLRANGIWYRIFLDAGLLFVDEVSGPTPEDDLEEGEGYSDLGAIHAFKGEVIRDMQMSGGLLNVRFTSGRSFSLRDDDHGSRFAATP